MANTKNAILRAKIEGVLVDLLIKTNAENVFVGDVTLAAKLAEIIASLSEKATSSEMTGAIAALRTELMGEGVPEAYDTFKELADYIATHQEAADALTAAIGNKADKSTVEALQNAVNALGALSKLDKVGESNLDDALKEKVNAAAEGNHSHNNKAELDKIAVGDKAKWDAAEGKVNTLVGDDTGKSARTIAAEELAKQLIPETAAESLNELTEIAAWIQAHPGDATAMNAAITALQNKLSGITDGTGTVKTYIDDAITALKIGDYAKAADLTQLASRVSTLEGKSHEHTNKTVLDGITQDHVASWNAKAKVYAADATVDAAEGEIFVQLTE